MKPAVFRPAARSRVRCSMGRRTSAWVPVMKTRPDCRVYLSSRLTCRTRSGAFMSPGILPGREPRSERPGNLRRPLERRKMTAFLYDHERCPWNPFRHLLVPIQGCDGIMAAAKDQGRARDGREQRQAVDPTHDRLLLPDERIPANVSSHFLDSGY